MIANFFTDKVIEQIADEIVFLIKEKEEFKDLVKDVAREIAEKIGDSPINDGKSREGNSIPGSPGSPKNDEKLREQKWQLFIKRQSPYERKFITKLKELFGKQEKEVLANMKHSPKAVKKGWEEDWLFNEKLWVERFGKEGKPFIGGVMESVGVSTLADLAVGIDFDISSPAAVQFQKKFIKKYSEEVNKATVDSLKKTLQEGIGEGESIPHLRKRVSKVFDFADRQRSTMIARTETIRASNFGAEEAYIQSGVVEGKEWLTAFDERTCTSCEEMGGKTSGKPRTAKLGQSFDVSDIDMNFDYTEGEMPYPPLHPSCRCSLIAILIE